MQAAQEIRQKLILVIGNLLCRCIEDARKIPYVLDREQVLDILVRNPLFFARLVREEKRDSTEFSSDSLTAKLDAMAELGQFEALDAYDISLAASFDPDVDLNVILDQVNRLTRTFVVYLSNTTTIFEKEFQQFMEKFHQSLNQAGLAPRITELTVSDMAGLEDKAGGYLAAGMFLQAFLFDRLLNADVITKELVRLPSSGYSFSRSLLLRASKDAGTFAALVKFLLRACYVSQGTWEDLLSTLMDLVAQDSGPDRRSMLIDGIEQDGIFCCNLLREPLATLRSWPPGERRAAIEKGLASWRHNTPAGAWGPS